MAVVHKEIIVEDFGPVVSRVMVGRPSGLVDGQMKPDAFAVQVVRQTPKGERAGNRQVKDVYASDAQGNRDAQGAYVTLTLDYVPDDEMASAIKTDEKTHMNTWTDDRLVVKGPGIHAAEPGETYRPQLTPFDLEGMFTFEDAKHGQITMNYAAYRPAGAGSNGQVPLIVWLHGAGEGGHDASIPIGMNKACAFADESLQRYFQGGAYVLVPQAETVWMDEGHGRPFYEGKTEIKSRYTGAVLALLDAFLQAYPEIDKSRVYLGGCSNGGYMTVLLALEAPERFAAIFPVCEAAGAALISDAQLARMKAVPAWFIHAANDPVVNPNETAVPLAERLEKMGAGDVWISLFADVRDTSGRFKQPDGAPWQYNGHFSWIYVYNNEPARTLVGKTVTLMEWLASKRRGNE